MNGSPPREATTRLCLSGESFWGAPSYKRMTPLIDPPAGTRCHERLRADLRRRNVYVDFGPDFKWLPRQYADGIADAHCGGADLQSQYYTACTSRFFSEISGPLARPGLRVLNRDEVAAALVKSGSIALLDQAAADERARADAAGYARYQAEYRDAITLEKITAFEQRYAASDRDGLIPTLQPRKRQLLHEVYLSKFNSAKSAGDLTAFIQAYAQDDPDGLVPQARRRLAIEQARERVAQEKQAVAARQAADMAKRKDAAARVTSCKRMTSMAYAALERERSIAAVSGVENLTAKRQAGEIIIACQRVIGRGY